MVSGFSGKAQLVMAKRPIAYGADGDGDGDGDAGNGDAGNTGADINTLLNDPAIQAAIQARLDEEVAGLKKKNDELIDKQKKAKDQLKQYEGLDVDRLRTLQKQLENDEEMRLLSEGKVDEVVTRRVELLKKDYEQQIGNLTNIISGHETTIKGKDEKLRELIVDGAVREAYISLDFEPAAMDDVIRTARDIFILGEDGKVIPRNKEGAIIFSKDGKTPIDAKGWLETQADRKPYLKRTSKGAGAQGSKGGASTHDATTSVGQIANGLKKLGFE